MDIIFLDSSAISLVYFASVYLLISEDFKCQLLPSFLDFPT